MSETDVSSTGGSSIASTEAQLEVAFKGSHPVVVHHLSLCPTLDLVSLACEDKVVLKVRLATAVHDSCLNQPNPACTACI